APICPSAHLTLMRGAEQKTMPLVAMRAHMQWPEGQQPGLANRFFESRELLQPSSRVGMDRRVQSFFSDHHERLRLNRDLELHAQQTVHVDNDRSRKALLEFVEIGAQAGVPKDTRIDELQHLEIEVETRTNPVRCSPLASLEHEDEERG